MKEDIVLAAVIQNWLALDFIINDSLKYDKDIVLACVSQDNGIAFPNMPCKLRSDKDIVLAAIKQNSNNLSYALGGLDQDEDCWIASGRWSEEFRG